MNEQIILYLLLLQLIISFFLIFIFFINRSKGKNIDTSKSLEAAVNQLVILSDQKLNSQKNEIRVDLQNKKEMIEDLVKRVLDNIESSNRTLEVAERERIGSFQSLKKEIENQRIITEQLSATTESLKKVLSNNQLRGQFGEQVAENLLKMSGFVKGIDYFFNKEQKGSETRPDFTLLLPDKTKVNVDAKFPFASLQRYIDTEDQSAKASLLSLFEKDVREKIKQVSTRDYINPDDKTVDFVILFIPNEMIFSFVYDKFNDLWQSATENKVILCGPFSFTAILRMIKQAYDNFKYQENAQQIIGLIKQFSKEFDKYNEEFEKIGIKINQLSDQYEKVNGVRTRQLVRTIDKIGGEHKGLAISGPSVGSTEMEI